MRFKSNQFVRTDAFGMKSCIGVIQYCFFNYYFVHINSSHKGMHYSCTVLRFDEELTEYE